MPAPAEDRGTPTDRRSLAEIAAKNIRGYRALRGLKQVELADRLGAFGFNWTQAITSEIERNIRPVTVNELAAVAVALDVTVAALLDPAGPERALERFLDVGSGRLLPAGLAQKFVMQPWLEPEDAEAVRSLATLRVGKDGAIGP